MTFEEWSKTESIKPLESFTQHGNNIQLCEVFFPNRKLCERTFFPYFFLNPPTVSYTIDLVIPENSEVSEKVVEFGGVLKNYYTDEGYGIPEFYELENAWKFNEWYTKKENESKTS